MRVLVSKKKTLAGLATDTESNSKRVEAVDEVVAIDSASAVTTCNILATSASDPMCDLMHSITIKDNNAQRAMSKSVFSTDLESESSSKDMESKISIWESSESLKTDMKSEKKSATVEEGFNSKVTKSSTVSALPQTMVVDVNESASLMNFPAEIAITDAKNNISHNSNSSQVENFSQNNAKNPVFSVFDPSGDNFDRKNEPCDKDIEKEQTPIPEPTLFEFSPINDDWDDKADIKCEVTDSEDGISIKRNTITSPKTGFSIFDPSESWDATSEKLEKKNRADKISTAKENQSSDGKHSRDKESSRKSDGKKHRSSRRSRSPEAKSSKHRKHHRETSSERRRRKKKKHKDSRCRDVSPEEHRRHRRHSGDGGSGGSRSKRDHKSSSSSSKSKSSKSSSHGSKNKNESSNSDAVANLKSKSSSDRKSDSKHKEKRNESVSKSIQKEIGSRFEFDMFAEKMKKVIVRPNKNSDQIKESKNVKDSDKGSLRSSAECSESRSSEIGVISSDGINLADDVLAGKKSIFFCDGKNGKSTNRDSSSNEIKTAIEKKVDAKVSNSEDDEKSSPNKSVVCEVTCERKIKEGARKGASYKSTDKYLLNVVLHDKFKSCCDTGAKSHENSDLKSSSSKDSESESGESDIGKKFDCKKIGSKVCEESRMCLRQKSVASESVKTELLQIENKPAALNDEVGVPKHESKEDHKMALRRPSKIQKCGDSENSDKQKKAVPNLQNVTRNSRNTHLASQNDAQISSSDISSDSDAEREVTKELKILLPKNILESPAEKKANLLLQPSDICTKKRALSSTKIETENNLPSKKNRNSPPKKKNEIDLAIPPVAKIHPNDVPLSTKRIKTIPAKYKDDIDVTQKKESQRANKNNQNASDSNSSNGKKIKTSPAPPPLPPTKVSTRLNGNNQTNPALPGNGFPVKRVRTLMPVTRNRTEINQNNSIAKKDNSSAENNSLLSKTASPPGKGAKYSLDKKQLELISARNPMVKIEKIAVPSSLPVTKFVRVSLSKIEDVKDTREISPKMGIKTRSEKGLSSENANKLVEKIDTVSAKLNNRNGSGRTSTRSMGDTITKSPPTDIPKKLPNKPKPTPTKNPTGDNIPKKIPISSGSNIIAKKILPKSNVILSNNVASENVKTRENEINPSNQTKESPIRERDSSNNVSVSDEPENSSANKAIDLNNLNVINALDGKMIAYNQLNTQNGGQQPVVICLGYIQDDMIKSAFAQAGISFLNNIATPQNPNSTINVKEDFTASAEETTPQNSAKSVKLQDSSTGYPATGISQTQNQSQSAKDKNSFTASLNDKFASIVRKSANIAGKPVESSSIAGKTENPDNLVEKSKKLVSYAEKSDKRSIIAEKAASYDFHSDSDESERNKSYESQLKKLDNDHTADIAGSLLSKNSRDRSENDLSRTSYVNEVPKSNANNYSESESGDSPIYQSFSSDSSDSDDSDSSDDEDDDDKAKESDDLDPSQIPNLFADSEENKFSFIQSVTDAGFDEFQERAMANMLDDSVEKVYVSESESIDSNEPEESERTDDINSENEIDLIYDQKKEIEKIKLVNDKVCETISSISKAANRLVSLYGRLEKKEKEILMREFSEKLALLKEMKLFVKNNKNNTKKFDRSIHLGNSPVKNNYKTEMSHARNDNTIEEQILKNFTNEDSDSSDTPQSVSRNSSRYRDYAKSQEEYSNQKPDKMEETTLGGSPYSAQPVKSIRPACDKNYDYWESRDKLHSYSVRKPEIMTKATAAKTSPYSLQPAKSIHTTVEDDYDSSEERNNLHSYAARKREITRKAAIEDNRESPESLNKLHYYGARKQKIAANISPGKESSYSAYRGKSVRNAGQKSYAHLESQPESYFYSARERMQSTPVRDSAIFDRNVCTTSDGELPKKLVPSKPTNLNHPYSDILSDEELFHSAPSNKNLPIDDFASNGEYCPSVPARKNTQIGKNLTAPNNLKDLKPVSDNRGLRSVKKLNPIKIIPYSPSLNENLQIDESRDPGSASKSYQRKKYSNKIGDVWDNLISADVDNILLSRKVLKEKEFPYYHRGLRVPDELTGKPVEVLKPWFEELQLYNDRFMEAIWDLDLNYMEGEAGENNSNNSSLTAATSSSPAVRKTFQVERKPNVDAENIAVSRTLRGNAISSQNRTYKSKVPNSVNIRQDIINFDDDNSEGNFIDANDDYTEEPITRAKVSSFASKHQQNEHFGMKYINKSQESIQTATRATKEKSYIPTERSSPSHSLLLQTSFDANATSSSNDHPSSELESTRKRGRPCKSLSTKKVRESGKIEKIIPENSRKLSIPNFNKSAANLLKMSEARQSIGLLSPLNDPAGGDISRVIASKNQFSSSISGQSRELEPLAKKQRYSSPQTNANVSSFISHHSDTPQSQNKIIFKKITKKSNAGLREMPRILTEGIKTPLSSPSTNKSTSSSSKIDISTAKEASWNDSTSELVDLDPSQMPDLMAEVDVQNTDRGKRDKLFKRKNHSPEVDAMCQSSSANGYKRVRKQKNILDL